MIRVAKIHVVTAVMCVTVCCAFCETDYRVSAIMRSERSSAIINGELVREGDNVGGAEVEEIGGSYVVLTSEKNRFKVYLGTEDKKETGKNKASASTGSDNKRVPTLVSDYLQPIEDYKKMKREIDGIKAEREKQFDVLKSPDSSDK